jgi:DNA helicase-2/ATP-dependent DNA helicase PcrA
MPIDLLTIQRGTITAPAGCGKTQLIADALSRAGADGKPILVLTHTNAGVAALRARLDKAGVPAAAYRLATIEGWAMRIISLFPSRSGIDPQILALASPKTDYPAIRRAAFELLKAGHINDLLAASYSRLVVDEYQDCSTPQHAIIYYASQVLPTCVLGDPMQAIFGFGDPLADWEKHVCAHFPLAGELTIPWRWKNAGTEEFGAWLLAARKNLAVGQSVDLHGAPPQIQWVHMDGTQDHQRRLVAARTKAPHENGHVLIIGDSVNPPGQRQFASQTPGAVTVESVDLRDLVGFAKAFDLKGGDALKQLVLFAQEVMTNVGAADLLKRVDILKRGTSRKAPTDVERAAMKFLDSPTYSNAIDVMVEIGKEGGVRTHRPGVLHAFIKTLRQCSGQNAPALYEAAVAVREQNRLVGRPLPRRAVGSTLLLKGLEADVAVILDTTKMDAKNLYVAMTRGSKMLVICSPHPVLTP